MWLSWELLVRFVVLAKSLDDSMDRSKVTPYILKCSAVGASCLQLRLHKVPNLCSSAFKLSVGFFGPSAWLPACVAYVRKSATGAGYHVHMHHLPAPQPQSRILVDCL